MTFLWLHTFYGAFWETFQLSFFIWKHFFWIYGQSFNYNVFYVWILLEICFNGEISFLGDLWFWRWPLEFPSRKSMTRRFFSVIVIFNEDLGFLLENSSTANFNKWKALKSQIERLRESFYILVTAWRHNLRVLSEFCWQFLVNWKV